MAIREPKSRKGVSCRSLSAASASTYRRTALEPERAADVAFLIEQGELKLANRVRGCSRAKLGLLPCNLPPFCRQCAGVSKLRFEDHVTALCQLALEEMPTLMFLAGDFTVGETKTIEAGLNVVKVVLTNLRVKPLKVWAMVVGLIYTIEIAKSPRGRWWVHVHAFLAIDARQQPRSIRSLASAWARRTRVVRWPKIPFEPRSGLDRRFNRLTAHQRVAPLHAYSRESGSMRILPLKAIADIEPDLRARARYLRERKGEAGRRRRFPLAVLTRNDRLLIYRLGAVLNNRTGIFREHGRDDVKRLTRRLRDERMAAGGNTSLRVPFSTTSSREEVNCLNKHRRVRPSSDGLRARIQSRFAVSE